MRAEGERYVSNSHGIRSSTPADQQSAHPHLQTCAANTYSITPDNLQQQLVTMATVVTSSPAALRDAADEDGDIFGALTEIRTSQRCRTFRPPSAGYLTTDDPGGRAAVAFITQSRQHPQQFGRLQCTRGRNIATPPISQLPTITNVTTTSTQTHFHKRFA